MEGGGRIGACPWWEGVVAKGPCPPPPKNEKKEAIRGNFNLFHLRFSNEIRWVDIHCIPAKWKGVGGQALIHGERGWGLCPPPPRK